MKSSPSRPRRAGTGAVPTGAVIVPPPATPAPLPSRRAGELVGAAEIRARPLLAAARRRHHGRLHQAKARPRNAGRAGGACCCAPISASPPPRASPTRFRPERLDREISRKRCAACWRARSRRCWRRSRCRSTIDPAKAPFVILVVGVNGTGKTTTIGKLAARFRGEGRSVMLAAGDTFRAAAIEQLKIWGERSRVPVIVAAARLGCRRPRLSTPWSRRPRPARTCC